MMKRIIPKRLIRLLLLVISALLIFLVVIGGGWGEKTLKEPLLIVHPDSLLLFSHRGMINYFPENSMLGFEEAKKAGMKAIEVDVRKTKDNQYFLFHDPDGKRLLGLDKKTEDATYMELKAHKILFNGTETGSEIVLLEELLKSCKDDFVIYLDMKIASFKDADAVANIIKKNHAEQTTLVANAGVLFISCLEFRHPEINTTLEGFNSGKEWTYNLWPKNFRPDFLSGFAEDIDKDHVDWLEAKGILGSRIVYGVDKSNMDALVSMGIKKLIVDYDSTSTFNTLLNK